MPKRPMGLETEYGAIYRGTDGGVFEYNPSRDILSYFRSQRKSEFSRLLPFSTSEHEFWLGSNGSKLYLDGDHIENSTPECSIVRDIVLYDRAGDLLLADLIKRYGTSEWLRRRFPNGAVPRAIITKNNSDFIRDGDSVKGKRVSFYGSHENYQISGDLFPESEHLEFADHKAFHFRGGLLPFLASRVILHGAGGMYYTKSRGWHYVLSQRAFVIERAIGSCAETKSRRPLVQVRRDVHDYQTVIACRLHLIFGDSNMSPWSTYLRFGTTHLVMRVLSELTGRVTFPDLEDPVRALQVFSSDTALGEGALTCEGHDMSALEIQEHYLGLCHRLHKLSADERAVLEYWEDVLRRLKQDPAELSHELDWVIKLEAMRSAMKRKNFGFRSEKARLFDVMYSDISDDGIFNALARSGGVKPFFTDSEVREALIKAPATRARVRAAYLENLRKLRIRLKDPATEGSDDDERAEWHLDYPFSWSTYERDSLFFPHALDTNTQKIKQYFQMTEKLYKKHPSRS